MDIYEVQAKEKTQVDSKENVTPREQLPSTTNVNASLPQEDVEYYKLIFGNDVSMVRFKRLHCTACDAHIGSAPANVHNMFEHPVLFTLLCAKCREFYGDGNFEQGDDATDMFCRWCANGGNLYCCSFCSNTFCSKCISRNFDPLLRKKIEAEEKWKCFVCDPKDLFRARATCWALLQHVQRMNRSIQSCSSLSEEQIQEKLNTDETTCCVRRRRKRQRCSSNSEEEDANFTLNTVTKRKRRGAKRKYYNYKNFTEKIEAAEDIDASEVLPSLLSCELVECEDATVDVDGTIVPMDLQSAYQPPMAIEHQQARVNVVPSCNLLANPVNLLSRTNPVKQPRQIRPRYLSQNTTVPMVTIPNKNMTILNKASCTGSQVPSIAQNIIEIDSDPEVVPVIDLTQTINAPTRSNDQVRPIALVSCKDSVSVRLDMTESISVKSLNQRLLPHGEEACNVLNVLQKKFHNILYAMKRDAHRPYDLRKAESLVNHFHREVRNAVVELSDVNDRIIREYSSWKSTQMTKQYNKISSNKSNSDDFNWELSQLPLDMTCDSHSDAEGESSVKYPSKLIYATNVLDALFKIKKTVDRGVGNHVSLVDKSIQIFDVELLDLDKCIGQSCVSKVRPLTKRNSDDPTYEEQFIQFLQVRMSPDSTEETSRKLSDDDETLLMDLPDQTQLTTEVLEIIEQSVTPCSSSLDTSAQGEKNLHSMPGTSRSETTDNMLEENEDSMKNSVDSNNANEQVEIKTKEIYLACGDSTSENVKHNLNRTEDISEDDCIIINN